jgi:hypothetical protein
MLIIPIDNFKPQRGGHLIDTNPAIRLGRKGSVRINAPAQRIAKVEDGMFLHFYGDDAGSLFLKLDKDSKHGLKMRVHKEKSLCIAQSLNVVNHIVGLRSMELPEKGSLSVALEESDFGKFKMVIV